MASCSPCHRFSEPAASHRPPSLRRVFRAGSLDGIRVIDITTVLLGPYGTQILGDMGADVIKVEAPPTGDIARDMGTTRRAGMGGIFLNANRNKRSLGA